MNTYDPADGIVYLHLASETDPYCTPVVSRAARSRLAADKTRSPRTRRPRP